MGQVEIFGQLAIGFGLFQCRQVGTLHVFDDGQFQALLIGGLADEHRHRGQPGQPGGLQAAFPGNQDIASLHVSGCDDQRLEHAMLPDGGGQILQFLGMQHAARLARVGKNQIHRNQHDAVLRQGIFPARDKRSQSTTKSGFLWHRFLLRHTYPKTQRGFHHSKS